VPTYDQKDIQVKIFDQKLDHFNTSDLRRYNQTYFVNDQFYKPGGPVFVMIGWEGPATTNWLSGDESSMPEWMRNAKRFNAIAFMLAHRFYGQSMPLGKPTIENLRYLNTRQALADVAEFILFIKEQYNLKNAPLITFGGSYSGSLSLVPFKVSAFGLWRRCIQCSVTNAGRLANKGLTSREYCTNPEHL